MKKFVLLIAVCFIFVGSLFAQNLIVNPSFEEQEPAFWSGLNGSIGTELGWESTIVYAGFHSFKVTKSAATSSAVGWIS
ncbi:MAG: hypothetical protein KAX28_04910, partial [Candidatus Marinimicrobia bacterium]|nr:hypothetical protein [Candidatus Neomarinimicrobiota bacterium]